MDKLKGAIEIDAPPVIPIPKKLDDGVYVATFNDADDRLLFVVNNKIAFVLSKWDNEKLNIQGGTDDWTTYKNYKKVKTFDVKVGY